MHWPSHLPRQSTVILKSSLCHAHNLFSVDLLLKTSNTMSAPEIPALHSKAEYLKAVMYEGVTILEGTATWCQNCKVIAPEVAKMVAEYPNVKFYTYDVEECEDIAQELGVSQMPTFSIFKDGDIQEGVTGAKPKEIRKAIEGCLG
ncbi:thioredoxin-like protein [Paraphoma chrysanthemicola]|uniref:Thioredoxin-like protein n=1 Tax=Paraphoma chrysanthemicola TaxID=798071 RepID=A0A8K0R2C2_9PLEO|nr:thioredoxin-like protein [Paraphoma chrysanthemicola]